MGKVYYKRRIISDQVNSDTHCSNTKREFLEKHLDTVKETVLKDFDNGLIDFTFMQLKELNTKTIPLWKSKLNTTINVF